jgi:hypothetical protein
MEAIKSGKYHNAGKMVRWFHVDSVKKTFIEKK